MEDVNIRGSWVKNIWELCTVLVSLKLFQNTGFLNESRNLEKAIEGLENKNEEISHR